MYHFKEKFIAISFGIATWFVTLEILAKIAPASDYLAIQRPIICIDLKSPDINCLLRRYPYKKGFYRKGVLPPFEINAKKTTNDIGQFSDINFFDFVKADDANIKILNIGDSLTESIQVINSETYHGMLNSKDYLNDSNNKRKFISTIIGTMGQALPDYLNSLKFAQEKTDLSTSYVSIVIGKTDHALSFKERINDKGKFYFDKKDGSISFVESQINSLSQLRKFILEKSAIARYLIINLESHALAYENPVCKLFSTCQKSLLRNTEKNYNSLESLIPDPNNTGFKASEYFLDKLSQLRSSSKERIKTILIVDADRNSIYSNGNKKNSYFEQNRNYFMNLAKSKGFTVIDLTNAFQQSFNQDGKYLDFKVINDGHWNQRGHALVSKELVKAIYAAENKLNSNQF